MNPKYIHTHIIRTGELRLSSILKEHIKIDKKPKHIIEKDQWEKDYNQALIELDDMLNEIQLEVCK